MLDLDYGPLSLYRSTKKPSLGAYWIEKWRAYYHYLRDPYTSHRELSKSRMLISA